MRLAEFVLDNMEAILGEWEQFAKTIPAASAMNTAALRDDAENILRTIAYEMQLEQSADEQQAKSRGKRSKPRSSDDSPAEVHGRDRLASGFELTQMVAEYRALRASVIRLWVRSHAEDDSGAQYELTRFHEGMDQALAESVAHFSRGLDRSRTLFMGVLGHDLRAPLQVISSAAERLQKGTDDRLASRDLAAHIIENANRLARMIDDLLDVTRTKLGSDIPLQLTSTDLAPICRGAVAALQQVHPECTLQVSLAGQLIGRWDGSRLEQLVSNLLRNAIQHGDRSKPITLRASGNASSVTLQVTNQGEPIPPAKVPIVFEPLVRGLDARDKPEASASLGLGLYIACTIARAHEGSIEVESSWESGTTFTVTLPRAPAEKASSGTHPR